MARPLEVRRVAAAVAACRPEDLPHVLAPAARYTSVHTRRTNVWAPVSERLRTRLQSLDAAVPVPAAAAAMHYFAVVRERASSAEALLAAALVRKNGALSGGVYAESLSSSAIAAVMLYVAAHQVASLRGVPKAQLLDDGVRRLREAIATGSPAADARAVGLLITELVDNGAERQPIVLCHALAARDGTITTLGTVAYVKCVQLLAEQREWECLTVFADAFSNGDMPDLMGSVAVHARLATGFSQLATRGSGMSGTRALVALARAAVASPDLPPPKQMASTLMQYALAPLPQQEGAGAGDDSGAVDELCTRFCTELLHRHEGFLRSDVKVAAKVAWSAAMLLTRRSPGLERGTELPPPQSPQGTAAAWTGADEVLWHTVYNERRALGLLSAVDDMCDTPDAPAVAGLRFEGLPPGPLRRAVVVRGEAAPSRKLLENDVGAEDDEAISFDVPTVRIRKVHFQEPESTNTILRRAGVYERDERSSACLEARECDREDVADDAEPPRVHRRRVEDSLHSAPCARSEAHVGHKMPDPPAGEPQRGSRGGPASQVSHDRVEVPPPPRLREEARGGHVHLQGRLSPRILTEKYTFEGHDDWESPMEALELIEDDDERSEATADVSGLLQYTARRCVELLLDQRRPHLEDSEARRVTFAAAALQVHLPKVLDEVLRCMEARAADLTVDTASRVAWAAVVADRTSAAGSAYFPRVAAAWVALQSARPGKIQLTYHTSPYPAQRWVRAALWWSEGQRRNADVPYPDEPKPPSCRWPSAPAHIPPAVVRVIEDVTDLWACGRMQTHDDASLLAKALPQTLPPEVIRGIGHGLQLNIARYLDRVKQSACAEVILDVMRCLHASGSRFAPAYLTCLRRLAARKARLTPPEHAYINDVWNSFGGARWDNEDGKKVASAVLRELRPAVAAAAVDDGDDLRQLGECVAALTPGTRRRAQWLSPPAPSSTATPKRQAPLGSLNSVVGA
eukprot:TRINITY_DN9963_c0_g1_i1.p1 TRINITY_DN9963_c0_g1~~TRINITY_DN9963_c0_g1_i1.p1  ORF type:complete len:972 (+),score=116.75 TRINITY_DN9963_c0_g1_i1:934-3849(+)